MRWHRNTALLLTAAFVASAWVSAGSVDPAALEQAFVKTVERVRPSVVTMAVPYRCPTAESVQSAVLSGVVVRPEGYIVSLSNLLDGCDSVDVTFLDGQTGHARLVGYDPVYGLGVLKVEREDLAALSIAAPSALRPGAWVLMVGNAFGLSHSISWGVVSGVRKRVQVLGRPPVDMIQMTVPVNPGDSGCAVVNLRGELVGLASSSYAGSRAEPGGATRGISFAVPMTTLADSIEQIVQHGRVPRGWLGISIITVYLPARDRRAVQVVEVTGNSPGARAGLQPGDLIVSLNGKPLGAAEDMEAQILMSKPKSIVEIEVVRRGQSAVLRPALDQWRPRVARRVGEVEAMVFPQQPSGAIRLSGADRDAALRRRLHQLRQELHQLLKESEQ